MFRLIELGCGGPSLCLANLCIACLYLAAAKARRPRSLFGKKHRSPSTIALSLVKTRTIGLRFFMSFLKKRWRPKAPPIAVVDPCLASPYLAGPGRAEPCHVALTAPEWPRRTILLLSALALPRLAPTCHARPLLALQRRALPQFQSSRLPIFWGFFASSPMRRRLDLLTCDFSQAARASASALARACSCVSALRST